MIAVTLFAPLLQGVETMPLIAAVLAILAIGGVTSGITALLLRISHTGIDPKAVVWAVSAVMVTAAFFMGGGSLPLVDAADPAGTAAAWAVLTGSLRVMATALYDILLVKVWPAPPTPPDPALPAGSWPKA